MSGSARKLKILYTIPMFSQECEATYARFHDIVHTLDAMEDPPWEYIIVPLREHRGGPSPKVFFRDGRASFRLANYLRNVARLSREVDIVHVVQGDLINSLPPLLLVPPRKPVLAGPNLTTFFYPPHIASVLFPSFPPRKRVSYRLKMSRHWRNRLVFVRWSPLSRRYRVILAFSNYHKELLAGSGVDVTKVEIIPGGVRTDLFNPSGPRAPISSGDALSILYVADLRKSVLKGFDVLIEGLKYLEGEGIPFHVWVVGGRAEQLKTPIPLRPDTISFLGYVPRSELGSYYRGCDVFVNPSRFEVDGTTSMEALACGTPVIGTDLPSFAAKNLLTFRWADGVDLGRKLKEFYENRDRYAQEALANAGHWDIRAAIEKLLSVYESLV